MKWYKFKKDYLGKKLGEQLQMSEADAKALVDTGVVEEVTVDPLAGVVERLVGENVKILNTAVERAFEKIGAELKARPNVSVKDAADVDNNFGYENFGDYCREVKMASHKEMPVVTDRLKKSMGWAAENEGGEAGKKTPTGMNTQVADEGGIMIPPGFSQTIYQKVFDESDIPGSVDVYNIGGNSMVFPRLKEDSRATGSRYGGVRAYWVAEGNNVTSTKPGFDRMQLVLKKLMALAYVTQEQMDDSGISLEQFLMNVVTEEMRFMIGDAIINGNGVGQPLGILNSPSLVAIAKDSAQTDTTVTQGNVSRIWSRVQARIREGANWYINQDVEPQLDALALPGGSVTPLYLMPGGLTGIAPGRLKGRPVKFCEFMPTLGTQGDITLWNPSSYCMITKGGIKTAMSMHLRFDYDEMVFKFTYRCDGQPWWPKALTPYKGTNTLSTHVTVAGRP